MSRLLNIHSRSVSFRSRSLMAVSLALPTIRTLIGIGIGGYADA